MGTGLKESLVHLSIFGGEMGHWPTDILFGGKVTRALCRLNPCQNDCPDMGIGKRTARLMTMVAFPSIMLLGCPRPKKLRRTNALP